jgi:hypothetical protein
VSRHCTALPNTARALPKIDHCTMYLAPFLQSAASRKVDAHKCLTQHSTAMQHRRSALRWFAHCTTDIWLYLPSLQQAAMYVLTMPVASQLLTPPMTNSAVHNLETHTRANIAAWIRNPQQYHRSTSLPTFFSDCDWFPGAIPVANLPILWRRLC